MIRAFLLLLLSVLTGCSTVIDEGATPAVRVAHPAVAPAYNNVVFLDDELERRIEVQRSDARRTATNTVEVFVIFRNRTDYPQQIEARVTFMDREGVPLGGPSAWQRTPLEANTTQGWSETSLTPAAAYYTVEVREGR